MIDAGDRSSGDEVVNYLKEAGVDDLELVIATHAHEDHIGGLPEVFDAFNVEKYIDSGTISTTKIYKDVMESVSSEGCPASGDQDDVIKYGDLAVRIIEMGDNHKDVNDDSIIALVTYGSTKMLFTGDSESGIEQQLAGGIGHIDLFKSGHHGSDTSNSQALLSVIKPDISVISYGIGNSYGHPHKEAFDRLTQYSGSVLWTGGKSIVITSDGHNLKAQ